MEKSHLQWLHAQRVAEDEVIAEVPWSYVGASKKLAHTWQVAQAAS